MEDKLCQGRLFVYGFDKGGGPLLEELEILSSVPAYTYGRLYRCGTYPMLAEGREGIKVYGNLLLLNDFEENIQKADAFYACEMNSPKSLFFRVIKEVLALENEEKGEKMYAWCYVGNPDTSFFKGYCVKENLIESGWWEGSE